MLVEVTGRHDSASEYSYQVIHQLGAEWPRLRIWSLGREPCDSSTEASTNEASLPAIELIDRDSSTGLSSPRWSIANMGGVRQYVSFGRDISLIKNCVNNFLISSLLFFLLFWSCRAHEANKKWWRQEASHCPHLHSQNMCCEWFVLGALPLTIHVAYLYIFKKPYLSV